MTADTADGTMAEPRPKFGVPPPRDDPRVEPFPYQYPGLWDMEPTTGPSRMVLAPAAGHVDLLLDLSRRLDEPFGVLYVLLLSRLGVAEPGRYQGPVPLDRAVMESFLEEFRDFFEGDGRHHVWVTSLNDQSTLVYDNHNVIYAYGPLDRYEQVVRAHGLSRAPVRFPVPHMHSYLPEFDQEEARVLRHWEWTQFPLQPDDDP